jgi:hypothetical protein
MKTYRLETDEKSRFELTEKLNSSTRYIGIEADSTAKPRELKVEFVKITDGDWSQHSYYFNGSGEFNEGVEMSVPKGSTEIRRSFLTSMSFADRAKLEEILVTEHLPSFISYHPAIRKILKRDSQ